MDGIQMEPIGKYKADRNGSAKAAAWRNMVDQDLDDVAFLADTDKAREARELGEVPVAVCSQRRALCLAALVFAAMFATALIVVYATPQPECPCIDDSSLLPGQPPTGSEENATAANKERIASNGVVYPWRGARLPTFLIPKHYNLWLHPNLTTGELRGEVSIDFKVDRDTSFVVVNVRDMNVTERALFRGGGALGPKVLRTLDYPPADQTYIEFKEKLRRKYNYTLSLRFITKLDRSDKQRGFFLAGTHRHRCAVSRFWLTHARSAFPALDEPHLRATFKLTVVRDRFHVSLTNMPIVATEEAGFYLGHRLLQDEFATTPPMSPHMVALAVCRLQRRSAPPLTTTPALPPPTVPPTAPPTAPPAHTGSTEPPVEEDLPPPEISLYSDQQVILDESGPLLEWVSKTIQLFAYELNTSYPLPKFDIVVVEGGGQYSEGWGLITLSPAVLTDTKVIARLLAQQWFGGLVSPRWWSSQWLLEALTSVLGERAPALNGAKPERQQDALLVDHILPALRLDSSNSVRAVASPRLERADIEAAADELSLHKGAAIVSMAIEAAGQAAGRAALARLLRLHRAASADARDLWRALQADGTDEAPSHAWDGWCEKPGYPLLCARTQGDDVVVKQERFVMSADAPDPEPSMVNGLLTQTLRAELDELFYEPENITEAYEEDINATTTATPPTTRRTTVRTTRPPPAPRWIIPVTFTVGPPEAEDEDIENITRVWKNSPENVHNGTWYDVGSETKLKTSKWLENVTYLIWMNDTEMVIPELGKHKWVRYNVGARGLYRVAPQDQKPGESEEAIARRAAALYDGGAPAERALLLDDAFVLSRARRLPASRAVAAASRLRDEKHWAVWRVLLSHAGAWRSLLHTAACAPALRRMLAELPPPVPVYTMQQLQDPAISEDQQWLSGALLTAGVEWENENVTEQALALFDAWLTGNDSIPEIYQEAAFTAGVRRHGEAAWSACWRALLASHAAPRPLYSHRALLAALSSPQDDWLLYRFAYTVLSPEASRGHEWRTWAAALVGGACRWRGAGGVWRLLAGAPALPPAALLAAARCLHQPADYYRFKELFGEQRGAAAALDTIALNAAWLPQADADLLRYFNAVNRRTRD
ncbi:thyrotropin-releasing hormone-degrading ectoenzyme [Aricia agestis]|uniref:thyrotropin-releasing hormone-degrading ectoenzyme n=1 Tax=Aricia agestis TaxID=91739 RepID=UPI001C2053AC|nr:thyrotropin-releasing hormone-degrading ectoenzyme [Aricia agestis]